MTAPLIEAVGVSKWYGRVTALTDVSLRLDGGVWGLLGPNGSGKTTFLSLLAGRLRPSLGEVRVAGAAPFANPAVLRRIGICPEADALFEAWTGHRFVASLARLSGFPPAEAGDRAEHALDAFGLRDAMHRPVGGYSRGMRQRVKLAQAVVHDPDVLLLDEPLTGTDPVSRRVILDALRRRAEAGAVVLFSTHVLHEVEALTDRVLLIARGQVVAQGRVPEIRAMLSDHPHAVRVRCERPRAVAARLIAADGVVAVRVVGDDALEADARDPDAAYDALARALLDEGVALESIAGADDGLEGLFHHLVARSEGLAGTGADRGGAPAGRAGGEATDR